MSYSTYLPSNYQNDTKICINGVELLNRHELSSTQDRELQRFIDSNAHIVQWQERELPPPPPPKKAPSHRYEEMRQSLSRAATPLQRYSSMDKLFTKRENNVNVNAEPTIDSRDLPICPNIENHNYTNEFPGLEYLSDNKFIEDLIKTGHVSIGNSGLISQPGSRAGTAMGAPYSQTQSANSTLTRQSNTLPHQQYYSQPQQHQNNTNYYTTSENTTTTTTTTLPNYSSSLTYGSPSQYGGSQYGSMSNVGGTGSNYGTLKGGMKHTSTLPPTSPYSSLKRKGVSWLDQERARSLSPGLHQSHAASRQVHHQYNRPASTIHTTTYTTTY
uniref:Uncharacterized protein n=1 Tax=Caenorhabditis japonica TaxID=281687 RepID=A0A8R1HPK1_CAEJA